MIINYYLRCYAVAPLATIVQKGNVHSFNMVLSLSLLLAIGLLAITTTADSAVQQSNDEWQAYGNTINPGRWKRQLPEAGGGKCAAPMVRCHKILRTHENGDPESHFHYDF